MRSSRDIPNNFSSNCKHGLKLAREAWKVEYMKLKVTTSINKIQESQAKARGKRIRKANV